MKKLIIALGLFASVSIVGGVSLNRAYTPTFAEETSEVIEEETSEVIEEETSEVIEEEITSENSEEEVSTEEEKDGFFDKLSQGAKDFLIVAKEILNEPIVIGGVSVSLGAIVIFVIGKLFSIANKKKLVSLGHQIEDILLQLKDSASKKDYNALASQTQELVDVCKVLVDGTRNVKVKEQALAILKDFEPIVEDNKEFVIEETKQVVEDGKNQLDKTSQAIVNIVNKD